MANEIIQSGQDVTLIEGGFSAQEMSMRLAEMESKLKLAKDFFDRILVPNHDYGTIPGTNQAALFKPGAEKLCELYGLAINVTDLKEDCNPETGYYHATITITLVHRRTGEIVAQGIGSANTKEGRYRWRWVKESEIPPNVDKLVLQTKQRFTDKGQYTSYRIENDDPWTQWNTVLKMAKKRALVDATLSATRSSGMFADEGDDDLDDPEKSKTTRGSSRSGRSSKMCTEKQAKLIRDIAGNDDNLGFALHELFGVSTPEELSVEQASQAITKLRDMQRTSQMQDSQPA